MTMLIPLGVLAVGSVLAGMVWYNSFFGDHHKMQAFFGIPAAEAAAEGGTEAAEPAPNTQIAGQGAIFYGPDNHVIEQAHEGPEWVKLSPFIAMVAGFLLAFQMYIRRPDLPAKLAANQRPLYDFLLNKWYFDEIYDALIVRPVFALGRFLWKRGDGGVIDGGINGVAMGIVPLLTRLAGRAQSGYMYHYVIAMVLGIAIILTWVTLTGVTM
jgi:NADH-quinone oxidoreductase subunit L